jgi:DNA-binding XRE family transcriptional regulator
MIRTDAEYKDALARLADEKARLRKQEKDLRAEGLSPAAVKRVLDPQRSFHEQVAEEVESYERLQRGDVGELENLHGLGRLLIAMRIARGLTQRDLAEKLGVHETQISRDERNEYHGVTVERASRILDTLEADVRTSVRSRSPRSGSGSSVVRSAGTGRIVKARRRPASPARR